MRASLPLLALGLLACRPVTDIGDKIIGLTDPVLVGGIVLGSSPPAEPRLRAALEVAGFTGFTEARVVVADALEFQDIDQALIVDAGVTALPQSGERLPLGVDETGWYVPPTGVRLPYTPGSTLQLEAVLPDRVNPGRVTVPLPNVPDIDVATVHPVGAPLELDLTDQGFDYAFATVYDLDGDELFSNAPTTNDAIVDLVLPTSDPVESVTIPGDVFASEDVFIVGVAGLKRAPDDGIEGLNEALTSVLAGRLELFPILTGPQLVANTLLLDVLPPPPEASAAFAAAGLEEGLSIELQVSDLLLAGEPVEGAAPSLNNFRIPEVGGGRYRLDGLDPELRGEASVRILVAGVEQTTGYDLLVPTATPAQVPNVHVLGDDLIVPTPEGPWQTVLVTVAGPDGVTWSNVPQTAESWSFLMRNPAAMEQVRIPDHAFQTAGPHVLAIAALGEQSDTRIGLNPRGSHALAGTVDYHAVFVSP